MLAPDISTVQSDVARLDAETVGEVPLHLSEGAVAIGAVEKVADVAPAIRARCEDPVERESRVAGKIAAGMVGDNLKLHDLFLKMGRRRERPLRIAKRGFKPAGCC